MRRLMRFDERLPERVAKALTAPKDVLRQRIDETGIGIAEPNSLGPCTSNHKPTAPPKSVGAAAWRRDRQLWTLVLRLC